MKLNVTSNGPEPDTALAPVIVNGTVDDKSVVVATSYRPIPLPIIEPTTILKLVPPPKPALALRISPTVYRNPPLVKLTVVTCPLAITMFAVALLPVPPVNGTFKYVPSVYPDPPTRLLAVNSEMIPEP